MSDPLATLMTGLAVLETIDRTKKAVAWWKSATSPDAEKQLRKSARMLGANELRVSCGQLMTFEIDGRILLLQGGRIPHQLQPPGGVVRCSPAGWGKVKELGGRSDVHFPIRPGEKHDLRIRIPGNRFEEFLDWYKSRTGREVTPSREFEEELLETGVLDREDFRGIDFEYERTYAIGVRYSPFLQCEEVLIHDVFRPMLSEAQEDVLRRLIPQDSVESGNRFDWVTHDEIRAFGASHGTDGQPFAIAEHALWMTFPKTAGEIR